MNRIALMLACVAGLLAAGCSESARQQPTTTTATTANAPANGSHEAVAWLCVRGEASHDQGGSDAYRNTQAQLIKSPLVLNAASRPQRDIVAIDAELAAIEAMKDVPPAEGQPALPNPALLRARREIHAKRVEEISREFDQVAREVTALGNANADLEARRIEIAELQAVTDQLGTRLNEVDLEMPNRVVLIEEAAGGEATNGDAS